MSVIDTFLTDVLTTVDNVIGNYVQIVYNNFIHSYSGTITLLFTFYVIMLGYKFIMHSLDSDLTTVTKHVITLLIVYGLIMSWALYNKFFYNIFTVEPGNIAQVMLDSAGSFHGESTAEALNKFFVQGMDASASLFKQVPYLNLDYLVYAIIVWLATIILCAYALLLLIYAKMAMAIGLALAPIFIPMLLWPATKGFFEAWIRKLFNFALIPIVTTGILALMLSVIRITIPDTSTPPTEHQFYVFLPFIFLSLSSLFLLWQVFPICASLSGGMRLDSISRGLQSLPWFSGGHGRNNSTSAGNNNTTSSAESEKDTSNKASQIASARTADRRGQILNNSGED